MRRLYDFARSGNCHKIRMMLSILGLDCEIVPVDLLAGAQMDAEFLKLNPLHKVPVLDDGGFVLRDSAAILVYLARKYGSADWYPQDAEGMGEVQKWLSFSVHEIASAFLPARAIVIFGREGDLEAVEALSRDALAILEDHLQENDWLACGRPTIADIACYPYAALLEEGRLSLAPYPAIRAWFARVEALPGYARMQGLPYGS